MPVSAHHEDWNEIIYLGLENQQVDFKAAQDWNELTRPGRAKFARHCMAMANTKGGYVVVGVGEDSKGNPTVYTGLTEVQAKSFDPSTVGQTINRYADPSIEFDIVRPVVDGRLYAVFVVQPFQTLPHVCSDTCENELQRGVFYVRTPDARSRAAYRASEVHAVVQRALRNQRQILGRMLRGILYEGRQFAESEAEHEFKTTIARCRIEARKVLGSRQLHEQPVLEVWAYPGECFPDSITLSDMMSAVTDIVMPPDDGFLAAAENRISPYTTNDSVRSHGGDGVEGKFRYYWEFGRNGLFYLSMLWSDGQENPHRIDYGLLVRRIGNLVAAMGHLYADLGQEAELLTMAFRLVNAEGCLLEATESDEQKEFRCYIPEIEVTKRRTVADLASAPDEHAAKVVHEVCERFNFQADFHTALSRQLNSVRST